MKQPNNPIRLLAEILAIVALCELVVMLVLPSTASNLGVLAQGGLNITLLLLLSAPLVYWRGMAITRMAAESARTSSARPVSRQTSIRTAVIATAAAQLVGLALTGVGVWWQHRSVENERQTRFDRAVDRVDADVRRRLEFPVYGLTGIRSSYAASDQVTDDEFRELVRSLDIERLFPGVSGFGYLQRVLRPDLERFVAAQQAGRQTPFAVKSTGSADDLYVVKHIEPLAKNFETLGLDFGQDPWLREALERAVATGEASLSGRIVLTGEGAMSDGLVYALPIYRRGADPTNADQRVAALTGVIFAPIAVANMLSSVADIAQEAVQVELFDGDVEEPSNLLFSGYGQLATLNGGALYAPKDPALTQTTRVLLVGGRSLQLRVGSTPAFNSSLNYNAVTLTAVGGAGLSLLLALAVWLLASGRVRAQNLAKRMTSELDTMARVVQTTDNAVVITDAQLHITWVNAGFTRMSGYTLEEARGRSPGDLLGSGKTDPETIARLSTSANAGIACRVEVVNRAKDGHEYWLDTDVHPMHDANGELVSFMEVGTDISVQKRAQLELQTTQQRLTGLTDRLNLAIEGGNDGLWDWMDVHQDAQWWSPSYYTLLGYSEQQLPATALNFVSLIHPDHQSGVTESIALSLHHGKPYDHAMLLRTARGGYRWFRMRAKVYRDASGNAFRMAGSAQDIEDRKQAEAEMRRAEELLRGSIDALGDAFALFDPQDRLVLCNQRYKDNYPLCADVIEPGNTFEHIIRVGAQRGQYQQAIGRVDAWVAERMAVHRLPQSDLQQVLEDGRILRISERRMPDGHTVGFRVDITEFIRAKEAAEDASRSKSQFLANMSHEIRTPMNAILGMLKLLQNTDLSAQQQDYAGKTEGAARSLLGLLNDILDFSKVEAGKMTLDPRPFRLDRLLRDLSVILSSNVGNKTIEVLFDVAADVPRALVGDDMRLQQVLINLGGNAIKFTSRGEVVLRLRVVEQTAQDVLLEFAVRDSGIGIAPENQAHIFSGFSQAEASTTRRFGGTGLGLAISSRLVRLMGGEMQLQSTPDVGSVFSFQIRMGRAAQDEVPEPLAPPQSTGQRTLIVDDNDIARDLLGVMAGSLGWKTDLAASGAHAVERVRAALKAGTPYEVVLVDWQMPEMDGWQTLQQIREVTAASGTSPAPLMLMVTAHGRDMLTQIDANAQAALNGFLVKPVTASMLLDAVMDGKASALQARSGQKPVVTPKAAKPKRLLGMRLLVVEDNKINQAVAQGLLSQEGAMVTLADNGRLGVDAVLAMQPAYDVVLMDLQMPVMDGFEATRCIRQELGLSRLPIIAMTANAMASDREACLAVGMNDHVGKPFELDHLVAVLLRLGGKTEGAQAPVSDPETSLPKGGVAQEYSPGDIDVAGALARVGGNTAIYANVLRAFAKDMVQVPAQVSAHLQADEQTPAVRALHTLKGLAATVGARHLAAVAAQLEHQVRSGALPHEHAEVVQMLGSAVQALAEALAPLLQQFQEEQASASVDHSALPPLDNTQLRSDLANLATLLRNSDMVALDVYAKVQQTLGAHLAQELAALKQPMDAFDFAAAATQCDVLLAAIAAPAGATTAATTAATMATT